MAELRSHFVENRPNSKMTGISPLESSCAKCRRYIREITRLQEEHENCTIKQRQDQSRILKSEEMYINLRENHSKLLRELPTHQRSLSFGDKVKLQHADEAASLGFSTKKQNTHIKGIGEDYETELEGVSHTLDKAEGIIRKLKDECERLACDLGLAEDQIETLTIELSSKKGEISQYERSFNQLEDIYKTEQELRTEQSAYTKSISQQKDQELLNSKATIEDLLYEKMHLERTLNRMEKNFKEIEGISQSRVGMYAESTERVQELEESLEYTERLITDLKSQLNSASKHSQEELGIMKRSVQMILKRGPEAPPRSHSCMKLTSTHSPRESVPRADLSTLLDISIAREHQMKGLLERCVLSEQKVFKSALSQYSDFKTSISAELERWIMRNEELEQRNREIQETNSKLILLVRDFQKALQMKSQHTSEQQYLNQSLIAQLQAQMHFVRSERNAHPYSFLHTEANSLSSQLRGVQELLKRTEYERDREIHSLESEFQQKEERLNSIIRDVKEIAAQDSHENREIRLQLQEELGHLKQQLTPDSTLKKHFELALHCIEEQLRRSTSSHINRSLSALKSGNHSLYTRVVNIIEQLSRELNTYKEICVLGQRTWSSAEFSSILSTLQALTPSQAKSPYPALLHHT